MTTREENSARGGDAAAGAIDLYAVLGLKKECTEADLKIAYKKLALKWHPDRCTASGNSRCIEEAKERFQQIQGAYSVLSDSNKRFLYDVGAYDSDDEDHDAMGDFLGEMTRMMSQIKPSDKNRQDSFEDLQQLFVDMFQADLDSGFCGTQTKFDMAGSSSKIRVAEAEAATFEVPERKATTSPSPPPPSFSSSFSFQFCNEGVNENNKRSCSDMNQTKSGFEMPSSVTGTFCFGASGIGDSNGRDRCNSKRRSGTKQQ